jgi:hypothetical protein
MTRGELMARLAGLRQAQVGQVRVPHKPLLLLWLFGQFTATGSSATSYQQAEEPVSQLINDFGPPSPVRLRPGSERPCRSFTWNESCGICGMRPARKSALMLLNAVAGCWNEER